MKLIPAALCILAVALGCGTKERAESGPTALGQAAQPAGPAVATPSGGAPNEAQTYSSGTVIYRDHNGEK